MIPNELVDYRLTKSKNEPTPAPPKIIGAGSQRRGYGMMPNKLVN